MSEQQKYAHTATCQCDECEKVPGLWLWRAEEWEAERILPGLASALGVPWPPESNVVSFPKR